MLKLKKQNFFIIILFFCLPIFYPSFSLSFQDDFRTYFEAGSSALHQGNIDEALIYFNKTIALNNNVPQAYFNKGIALSMLKNWNEAKTNYIKAIELNPNYSKAHLMLGELYRKNNQYNDAIKQFEKILVSEPNHFDATLYLAKTLLDQEQTEKALTFFHAALHINPNHFHAQLDYANALNALNRSTEALSIYKKLETQAPEDQSVLYNIAYTLKKLGYMGEALEYYQKTLAINPDHSSAHFGLAMYYLMHENFNDGWKEYEWRLKNEKQPLKNFVLPTWDGSDLDGKTILLHAEQGLGDAIQFIRFAKIAKEKGGVVIAAVHNPLVEILAKCPFIDKTISLNSTVPHFDTHCMLMSIPYILNMTVENIPQEIPYLYADEDLIKHWQTTLEKDKQFKIGICWQGNPNYSTAFLRQAVAAKSIQLTDLLPLLQMSEISFYSLQKTTGEEQLKNFPSIYNFHIFDADFDNTHGRFMDTAAVIKNLDLVITIDTSIAHLAAALGTPTWILLPKPADWRWMMREHTTPWYTNVQLFRQPEPGDWKTVIQKVIAQLQSILSDQHSVTKKQKLTPQRPPQSNQTINNNILQISPTEIIEALFILEEALEQETNQENANDLMEKIDFLKEKLFNDMTLTYELEMLIDNMKKINNKINQVKNKLLQLQPYDQEFAQRAHQIVQLSILKKSLKKQIAHALR